MTWKGQTHAAKENRKFYITAVVAVAHDSWRILSALTRLLHFASKITLTHTDIIHCVWLILSNY